MGHPVLLSLALFLLIATSRAAAAGHAQAHAVAAITQEEKAGVGSLTRSMVGSRPPSCEGIRCWWCRRRSRRCEAVQVPVTPQDQLDGGHMHGIRGGGGATVKPSSYDDHSNYKQLIWRCNCGGMLLHP